jgi:hypothetical protein
MSNVCTSTRYIIFIVDDSLNDVPIDDGQMGGKWWARCVKTGSWHTSNTIFTHEFPGAARDHVLRACCQSFDSFRVILVNCAPNQLSRAATHLPSAALLLVLFSHSVHSAKLFVSTTSITYCTLIINTSLECSQPFQGTLV